MISTRIRSSFFLAFILFFTFSILTVSTEPGSGYDSDRRTLEEGERAFITKNYGEAKHHFQKLVNQDPQNAEYLAWLAEALAHELEEKVRKGTPKMTLLPEAKKVQNLYEKAYKIDPNNLRARIGYAIMMREIPEVLGGNVKKAEEVLKGILEDHPQDLYALHHLGALYTKKTGRHSEGVHYLKKAIRIAENKELDIEEQRQIANTYNALGQTFLYDFDNPQVAIPYLEEAVRLDSDNVNDWLDLEEAYRLTDQTEKAKEALYQALKIVEQRNYVYFNKKVEEEAKKLGMNLNKR